ncbi:HAD domain-containing protein [Paraburkholderia phytofirmans]|uniref:HAD domain-containing protein n=1 Tax=Paraburkholderia phytofirmans TaxID=261302 RepID=UPI0038B9E53D
MVIYLNFDGVLHPDHVMYGEGCTPSVVTTGHAALEHVGLLAELLEPYSEIQIVLNTWWTFYLGLDACVEMLPPPLANRVDDATIGYASSYNSPPCRAIEMERHIARHRQGCFIILDHNNARYRPELLPHLLLLDPNDGLGALAARRSVARRLMRITLNGPVNLRSNAYL